MRKEIDESKKRIQARQELPGNRPVAEKVLGETDVQEMEVCHTDLIKRIQDSAIAAGMPPDIAEGMDDPGRHFEKQQRHKRYEFKVKVSSIRNTFSKIFGGKKS